MMRTAAGVSYTAKGMRRGNVHGVEHIKAVVQYTRNSYTLQLKDAHETQVPLSKQSEKELQVLLGY